MSNHGSSRKPRETSAFFVCGFTWRGLRVICGFILGGNPAPKNPCFSTPNPLLRVMRDHFSFLDK